MLLHEARNDWDAPRLARFMLWLGIAATMGANIAYGAGYGLLGALISAWPAVAFIGSVEIAMQQVRRARAPGAAATVPEVPGDVGQAVRTAYAASVAAGQPLSQRAMAERFGLSRHKVSQLITTITVDSNCQLPAARKASPGFSGMFGEPPDDLVGLGFDVARVAAFHQDSQRVPGRGLGHGVCFGQPGRRGQQRARRVGAIFNPFPQQPR